MVERKGEIKYQHTYLLTSRFFAQTLGMCSRRGFQRRREGGTEMV